MKSDHFTRSYFPAQPASMIGQPLGGSWSGSSWTGQSSWPSPHTGPMYNNSSQVWPSVTGGKTRDKGYYEGASADDAEAIAGEVQRRLEQASCCLSQENVLQEAEVGYTHDFRRYTKQQIVDICSSVDAISKPESFVRFEKEQSDSGLFRQSPLKDWAPPPTPLTMFSSGMLESAGAQRRSTSASGQDDSVHGPLDNAEGHCADEQHRRRPRPDRKLSAPGARPQDKLAKTDDGEHRRDAAPSGDWNDWEWPASGGAGWAPEVHVGAKGKGRHKRMWVQKQSSKGSSADEDHDTDKPTWADRVKGSAVAGSEA